MLVVAVVGSIGSGKSSICHTFQVQSRLKTKVIDLDIVAKELRTNCAPLKNDLIKLFGTHAQDNDYMLDVVFTDDDKYEQLIQAYSYHLHQYMIDEIDQCASKFQAIIFEGAALIHNKLLLNMADNIIWVSTPRDICRERVITRKRYSSTQVDWLLMRTQPLQGEAFKEWKNGDIYPISSVDGCDRSGMVDWVCKLVEKKHQSYSTQSIAIYQGSFNPLHIGHLAIITQLLRTFDKVILLRCKNGAKSNIDFYPIDRTQLPHGCELQDWTESFVSYLGTYDVSAAKLAIIRGIRNGNDLQYEQDYIAHVATMYEQKYSRELPPVLFVSADKQYQHISSSSIRAIIPFEPEYAKSLMV